MIQLKIEYSYGRYLADLLDMKGIEYVIHNLEALTKGSTKEYFFEFETAIAHNEARSIWKNLRFAMVYGADVKTIKRALGGKKETVQFINMNEFIFANLKAKICEVVVWHIQDGVSGVTYDLESTFDVMLARIKEEGLTSVGKLKAYLQPQNLLVAQFGKQTGLWVRETFRGYTEESGS